MNFSRITHTISTTKIAWLTALFFACLWAAAVTLLNVNRSDVMRPLALTKFDNIEVAGTVQFGSSSGPTIADGGSLSLEAIANRLYLDNGTTTTRLQFQSSAGTNYIQSGVNGTSNSAAPLRIGSMLDGTNWLTFDATGATTFRQNATFEGNVTAGHPVNLDSTFNFWGTLSAGKYTGTSIAGGFYNFVATDYSAQAQGTGGSYKMDGAYTDAGAIVGAAEMKASKSNSVSGDVGHDLILATKTSGDTGFDSRLIIDQVGMQVLNTAGVMAKIIPGNNTPEGAVTAPVGSIFLRANGASGTTLYTKATGVGNTGWEALGPSSTSAMTISITRSAAPASVNLSTEGTVDWLYLGDGTQPITRTVGAVRAPSNRGGWLTSSFRWRPGTSFVAGTDNLVTTFQTTASDDLNNSALSSTATTVYFNNNGGSTVADQGWLFRVPSRGGSGTRRVRFYGGGRTSTLTIRAAASDGSVAAATNTVTNVAATIYQYEVLFTGPAGTEVMISAQNSLGTATFSNIYLGAITVADI